MSKKQFHIFKISKIANKQTNEKHNKNQNNKHTKLRTNQKIKKTQKTSMFISSQ